MKVLLVSDWVSGFGGAPMAVGRIARSLTNAGCEVVIACARRRPSGADGDAGPERGPATAVYELPSIFYEPQRSRLRNFVRWRLHVARVERGRRSTARWLSSVCRRERPDVAHVCNVHFELSPSVFSGLAEAGVPIVFHPFDHWLFCARRYAYVEAGGERRPCRRCFGGRFEAGRELGCYAVGVLPGLRWTLPVDRWRRRHWGAGGAWRRVGAFVSPAAVISEALAGLGVPSARVHRLHYPIELEPAEKLRPPGDYFVYYGSTLDLKGAHWLANALRGAKGVKVRFYVDRDDAELRSSLAPAAKHNEIHVDWESRWHTGVKEAVAGARAVIVPSLWETVGEQTLYEAMALGRAVVASRRGAHLELIEHGRNGLLFEPKQEDSLLDALARLSGDRQTAAELGRAARRTAEGLFDSRSWAKKMIGIYQQLLAEQDGRAVEGSSLGRSEEPGVSQVSVAGIEEQQRSRIDDGQAAGDRAAAMSAR